MTFMNFKENKGYLFKTIHLEEIINPKTSKAYTKEVVKREPVSNKPDLYLVVYHGNGKSAGMCYDTSPNRIDSTKKALSSILTQEEYFREFQEMPLAKHSGTCCDIFSKKHKN